MDIKGLKFTHKSIKFMGGEGSGHHGHSGGAGGPDNPGGSRPDNACVSLLQKTAAWTRTEPSDTPWKDLTLEKKSELIKAANSIPDSHVEGATILSGDERAKYLTRGGTLGGVYFEGSGEVALDSMTGTGSTLIHEIGHHVMTKLSTSQLVSVQTAHKAAKKMYKKDPEGLAKAGLGHYGVSNFREFWGCSYQNWGDARLGKSKSRKFIVPFKEQFPEVAGILEGLFKGE